MELPLRDCSAGLGAVRAGRGICGRCGALTVISAACCKVTGLGWGKCTGGNSVRCRLRQVNNTGFA